MWKIIVNNEECILKTEIQEGSALQTNATKLGYEILDFNTEFDANLYIIDNNLKRTYEQDDIAPDAI